MTDILREVGRFAQMKEFDGEGREVTIKSLNKLYVGDGDPKVEKEITLKDGRKLDGVNRQGYTYRLAFVDHAAGEKPRMLNVMYDDFFFGLRDTKARAGLRGILKRSFDEKWQWKFYENPIQAPPTPTSQSPIT